MAGDVIADAIVRIGADTSPAEREVAKFQHEFDARMAAMDRQRATAEVDLSSKAFDREEAEIRARMKALNNLEAHPEIDLDADGAKAEIKWLNAKLDQIGNRRTKLKIDASELKAADRQIQDLTKREQARAALAEKASASRRRWGLVEAKARADDIAMTERQGRVEAAAHAANEKRSRDRGLMESKAWAEREKRMQSQLQLETRARRQNAAYDAEQAEANLRRIAELDKLRIAYAKALSQKQYYEKKTGRPGGMFRSDAETRALKAASSEVELLRHRIVSLDGSVTDINPNLESHQGLLGRWANSLSSVRLQLGFFSATLRQLGIGAVALGPILSGLLGAATSLIGVLGTGLAGAIAVSSAGLAGFLLSAGGIGMVLKPAIDDFSAAAKASDALADAQLKYGKNSDEARTAQEKLNQTLKGIDPAARDAIRSWGQMKDQWADLTKETRKPIFDAIASSITTAKALLPSYAAQTVATTKVVGAAWERGMSALRGPEAKRGLNELMANFRSAIPAFTSGFGSLAAMMGRISVSASKLLPSLGKGFADWAQGLEDAVGGGDKLDAKIQRLVGHMRSVGRWAQSAGSLLVNMFDSSADAGDGLLKSMTKTFDRWDEWVQSAGGQKSLADFFSDAAREASQLASLVAHFTTLLWAVARAGAPISDALMTVLNVVGDLVTSFAPLRTLLGAAAWVGFASIAVRQIAKITGALNVARGALTALSAVSAGGALAGMFGGKGGASKLRATTAASQGLAMGMGAVAARGGLMAAALNPAVLIPVGAIAALALFIGKMEKTKSAWQEATEAFNAHKDDIPEAIKGIEASSDKLTTAYEKQTSAQRGVRDALSSLNKLRDENAPLNKQTAAVQRLNQAEIQYGKTVVATSQGHRRSVKATEALQEGAEARIRTAEREIRVGRRREKEGIKAGEMLGEGYNPARAQEGAKQAAHGMRDLARAQREAQEASIALAAAMVPTERRLAGLKPISDQAQVGLERLSTTIGAAATKKIGNFVDPKAIQQITNLGNRMTSLGRGQQVKNIAVKSSGAEETTAKLQRLQRTTTKVEGARANIKVGANDAQAQAKLKRLGALSQRLTGGRNTIKIMANSASAEAAIARLRQNLRAAVAQQYKAEISAADKTGPGYNSAKHKMRDIANTRAEINIRAIDNATRPAGAAKRAVDQVKDKKANVSVVGAGAAVSAANSVASALAAIQSKSVTVHTNYTQSGRPPGTNAMGGPSDYTYQRAGDVAVVEPRGRSRRVARPTMLTGEERGFPEYVIATNPAYRASNELYLEQAAASQGKEVIPAYAKGKGGKAKPKKAGTGADNPKAPYKHQSQKWVDIKPHGVSDPNVTAFENFERTASNKAGLFNAVLGRQEQEIQNKKRTAYDFPQLKDLLSAVLFNRRSAFTEGREAEGSLGSAIRANKKVLNTDLSKGKISAARKSAVSIGKQMREWEQREAGPRRGPGETDEQFKAKERAHNKALPAIRKQKKALEKAQNEAKRYAKRLEKERKELLADKQDRESMLAEVKGKSIPEAETEIYEAETENTNYAEMEANPALTPYAESVGGAGGGDAPSLAEQTASFNTMREDLYKSYASNITSGGGAAYGTSGAAGVVGPGGGASAPPGIVNGLSYTPGGASLAGSAGTSGSAAGGSGGGKVVNVTNNFAAPPPDPHTWAAGSKFETEAIG